MLCLRIRPYVDKLVGQYQAGFIEGASTTNQISCLRQILENTLECGIETHHVFIDFTTLSTGNNYTNDNAKSTL